MRILKDEIMNEIRQLHLNAIELKNETIRHFYVAVEDIRHDLLGVNH